MNAIIIKFAFLLLIGFHRISVGENSVLRSKGKKLPSALIGGHQSRIKQFPYAVSIQRYNNYSDEYQHSCTGSLITTLSVLSAAHCVLRSNNEIRDVDDYIGILGTVDNRDTTYEVNFHEICVHGNYNDEEVWNDIAILVLSKPAKLGENIKTIPLIGAGLSIIGMRATVLGWGQTNDSDVELPPLLRYVDVDIATIDPCDFYYGNLSKGEMCFGTEKKGICEGDSGGPIVVTFRNKEVQAGISSYTDDPCAFYPSVGINISVYTEWIRNNAVGTPVFIN